MHDMKRDKIVEPLDEVVSAEPPSLLARVARRPSLLQEHPHLAAGPWFTAAGFVVGLALGAVYALFLSIQFFLANPTGFVLSWAVGAWLPMYALLLGVLTAIGAIVPGLWLGGYVLKSNHVRTEAEAGKQGVQAVGFAHCVLPFVWLLIGLVASPRSTITIDTFGFFAGVLACCVITVPFGSLAGKYLYRIREGAARRPPGCSIHGYREGTEYGGRKV